MGVCLYRYIFREKKMKRAVALMSGLLSLSIGFAFAGGRQSNAGTGTGGGLLSARPVTIVIGHQENRVAGYSYANNLPVWAELSRITGVTIRFDVIAADYDAVMATRIAAGADLPDMFPLPRSNIDVNRVIQSGALAQWDSHMNAADMPELTKIYQTYPEIKKLFMAPDGHYYTGPIRLQFGDGRNANPETFMLRKDWVDLLGLKMPKTIDEWHDVLTAFKNNDVNQNGNPNDEVPFAGDWGVLKAFARAWGINNETGFHVDPSGKVVYGWITEDARQFLKTIQQWYREGLIYDQVASTNGNLVEAMCLQDLVGSTFMWASSNCAYQNVNNTVVNISQDPGRPNWIPVMPPQGNPAIKPLVFMTDMVDAGWYFGISSDSKNKDIAFKLYDFMFSERGSELITYGIEGIHWNPDPGYRRGQRNYYAKTPMMYEPDEWAAGKAVGTGPDNLPQGSLYAEALDYNGWLDLVGANQELRNSVINDLAPNFVYRIPTVIGTDEESRTVSTRMADILTLTDETLSRIIINNAPVDAAFDTFVRQVQSMGIDEVLRVKQAQYDRSK
jgi:putative aldouronate transport system substrate-binding protein